MMKFTIALVLWLQCITLYSATARATDDRQPKYSTSNKSFFDLPTNTSTRLLPSVLTDSNRFSPGYTDLSRDEIEEVVRQHNAHRANTIPSAADMKYMTWNDKLATMSQDWADGCVYEHGGFEPNKSPFSNVGQNLYLGYGRGNESPVLATTLWHDEDQFYSFDSNTCRPNEVCGHYTQVVWADSSTVGCGRKLCSQVRLDNGEVWTDAYLIVCNYGPAGNVYNELPFTRGDRCSQCPDDAAFCTADGLCRDCTILQANEIEHCGECQRECQNCGTLDKDTCTCQCAPGWDGVDCSEPCADHHEWCGANPGWPTKEFCNLEPYATATKRYCRQMCGSCLPPSADFQCIDATMPPRTVKSTKYCKTTFTSVAVINQQLYAFKKDKFWRFDGIKNGQLLTSTSGDDVRTHFEKVNPDVRAVYQRETDGKVLFFRGKNYWEYTKEAGADTWIREAGFPRPIAEDLLGLPKSISAALYDRLSAKTYFFKGSYVWRYDERARRFDLEQERIEDVFEGVPSKLSGAFQDENGDFIFVKGRDFWRVPSGESRVSTTESSNLALNFMDCYE